MSDPITQFSVRYHEAPRAGRLAIMTMDNGEDYRKPNTFGDRAFDSLHRVLDDVERREDVIGLMLTGKPHVFAAGANLNHFAGVDAEFAEQAGRTGHEAFSRLSDLPIPTLAAINGVCLGGGLEIALHCDYRTMSTAVGNVAFPEVFLSILPAWGGTQLAPRVVGVEQALEAIVHKPLANNRMMDAAEAVERGFADRLVPAVDFLDESVALLARLVAGEETIERIDPTVGGATGLDEALDRARQAADDRVHGATPAPYRAIELVEFAGRGGDLGEGREKESAALTELLPARQAQASVYSFDLTQRRVRRQPGKPDVQPRGVTQAAIVGAGLMGAQIGGLLLQRLEVPLVMKDLDQDVLDQARQTIEGDLDKRVQRGRLSAGKARFLKSNVTYSLDDADVAGSDLVVEAVAEVMDVKKKVFADLERVLDEGAVLASNTSTLSISEMASDLTHPERVVGLHFFNPVQVMPLVEIIRGESTSDEALSTAFEIAKRTRKSAVLCGDAPGFVVNRVLFRFMGACARAPRTGTPFTEVDDAIKALGLPMGPFELIGLVGLEVNAHVARVMHEAFPDRFDLDPNFQELAQTGLPGIYDWSRGRVPYDEVVERWQVDADATPMTPEEIRRAAIEAVAEEIKIMLDEGVVADARDIDTCMLLGAGWPFFNGGICLYLDQTGVSQRLFDERLVGSQDRGLA
ncbi:3-hydroxyacyl-CoA dehydrogenase [Egibacter rhizosphaerae]|uniref:enoyl-CoA hydratase n=1 Tax=Egibacter rhizosphaerae TaxID=1670831 RepID=A0A411YJ87_9ACTN|nr:3-hydroxyacyl-CoA dehydrogenase NAD-binding domain-containing protein [Egibacter rhizosphaerae]QBI21136.1 3-hydroxyacyl-CoA dehydrogenase [Egibacter rhizosphaerae]